MNEAPPDTKLRIGDWAFFYATLWWNRLLNLLLKERRWWDWVDDHVLLGALPVAGHVTQLKQLGIGGVINTCREYCGPLDHYKTAGIEQLYLPTTDFVPPTIEFIRDGVAFIDRHIASGSKVYVHCKAGRGRSATIVMCYLISKGMSAEDAQQLLLSKRPHVAKKLFEREVVKQFAREYVLPSPPPV